MTTAEEYPFDNVSLMGKADIYMKLEHCSSSCARLADPSYFLQ